jgi:hypothetical protein
MRALLLSTVLLVTIPAAMAFGIGLGYVAILGIISLFGRQSRPRPTATVKMPALATAGD